MTFIQRFGYYLGGFSIGLIVLAFFLSGKKTSCSYGPEARVLKSLNTKPLIINTGVNIDTTGVKALLNHGNVEFSKSDTKKEPCRLYVISGDINKKPVELSIENCEKDSIARVIDILYK